MEDVRGWNGHISVVLESEHRERLVLIAPIWGSPPRWIHSSASRLSCGAEQPHLLEEVGAGEVEEEAHHEPRSALPNGRCRIRYVGEQGPRWTASHKHKPAAQLAEGSRDRIVAADYARCSRRR